MTERISNKCPCDMCGKDKKCELSQEACQDYLKWEDDCLEKLAEYETAEEEGRLVVLPCNVGDTVYALRQSWNGWNIDKKKFTYGMIGKVDKTIFLTCEEAEKALDVKQNESKN